NRSAMDRLPMASKPAEKDKNSQSVRNGQDRALARLSISQILSEVPEKSGTITEFGICMSPVL
ncbi:MAG: hypothetical protein LBC41_00890, partial [Clostridiales bacterium]|nr:hypothetical protein [Clostridiales bacterium]